MGTEVENKMISGIYLITSKHNDKENGMIAAWVFRLSIKPQLVGISIGKTRYSHDIIKKGGKFVVNFLSSQDKDVIDWFGGRSGKDVDKMAKYEWLRDKTGLPILKRAFAYMECEIIDEKDAGDHTIFIGKVVNEKLVENKETIITREYK